MSSPTAQASEKSPATRLTVDVLACRVSMDGIEIRLSRAESSVIFLLALKDGRCAVEHLAESAFPHLAERGSASGNLKVIIHRARRKVGLRDAVRCRDNVYRLHPAAEVDLRDAESAARRARAERGVLTVESVRQLESYVERICHGDNNGRVLWDVLATLAVRRDQIFRDAMHSLAEHDLRNDDPARCMHRVSVMLERDALDEDARMFAIRARLALGDRAGAHRHAMTYASDVQRELGAEPSDAFVALL